MNCDIQNNYIFNDILKTNNISISNESKMHFKLRILIK